MIPLARQLLSMDVAGPDGPFVRVPARNDILLDGLDVVGPDGPFWGPRWSDISKIMGVPYSDVKTVGGVAIENVKTVNGIQ